MIQNYFNRHHAQMQPRDLINLALDLERHLVEKHQTFFYKDQDDSSQETLRKPQPGNEAHIRKLETYQPG